jgi:hypothetical protein
MPTGADLLKADILDSGPSEGISHPHAKDSPEVLNASPRLQASGQGCLFQTNGFPGLQGSTIDHGFNGLGQGFVRVH